MKKNIILFSTLFLLTSIIFSQDSLWMNKPYRMWSKEYTLRPISWFDELKASILTGHSLIEVPVGLRKIILQGAL